MTRRDRYGAWSPLLLLVCTSAAVTTAQCVIPSDMERYWLAYAGDWSLAHSRILESLQGSWFPNRPWVNQEWLVAIATAWTRAHGLYVLLELLFAAALVFGVVFVALETVRTRTHPLIACAQVAATAIGAFFFAQDRAQTLVWVLLPSLILIWRRAPWAAVPLTALWANVHGSFPIAVVWMLLHLDRRRIAPFVAATAATLANPLGWRLWVFTIELARNARLAGYVKEWSPALLTSTGIVAALVALAPLWMRLAAGARLRRPIRYGDLLFIAASAIGTILAIRYAMLLFLASATTLGDALRTRAKPMPFATRAAAAFFSIVLVILALKNMLAAPTLVDPWFGNLESGVDFAACAPFVRGKRVFTDALQVGSLVELAGGSANVDGRIDAFPQRAIHDASHVLVHPRDAAAAAVVRHSGAQMLAIDGRFAPAIRSWRLERTCGKIRLYARSD
jgi:hypothetical protein